MASSLVTSRRVGVPRTSSIGKRSRSNSVSSSTSSTSSSIDGSIFSQFASSQSSQSSDSLSGCSSPISDASPTSTSTATDDDQRPCKALRTNIVSVGPISAINLSTRSASEEADEFPNLEKKCTLTAIATTTVFNTSSNTVEAALAKDITPLPHANESSAGKNLLVDCLVDATVHVLDMMWHAPVRKAIAFLNNNALARVSPNEFVRPCNCPVGSPFTQDSIPMDLFIRETLRRSRTSCSTLQAALLYCKRVGFEVVRKRVESEGVELSEEEMRILEGPQRSYTSLSRSLDDVTMASLPQGMTGDPILCSRRTFLASIMVSSKFLQDRTFSNRAWSKISGLNVTEVGLVERRMLDAIEFDLSIASDEWQAWTAYLKGEWKANLAVCPCKSVFDGRSVL